MDAAHELIWGYSYGSVTIEAICDRAGVKKGSFYYFFNSRSELAVAAIEAWRDERISLIQSLRTPGTSALEALWKYFEFVSDEQIKAYEENGQVLGCPLFTLGSEICTQDEALRSLIHDILSFGARYFEETLREAAGTGEINGHNVALKARLLWGFYEGTLTRARIENNPDLVRDLSSDALELVGARPPARRRRLISLCTGSTCIR